MRHIKLHMPAWAEGLLSPKWYQPDDTGMGKYPLNDIRLRQALREVSDEDKARLGELEVG